MSLAHRLRQRRKEIGETQTSIAKLSGFVPNAISMFECGQREPNIASLRRLCLALKCSADYLIGLKEK